MSTRKIIIILKTTTLHYRAVRLSICVTKTTYTSLLKSFSCPASTARVSLKILVINKLNIITSREFGARFPTTRSFNQQPFRKQGEATMRSRLNCLEVHEVNQRRRGFPLKSGAVDYNLQSLNASCLIEIYSFY